VKVNIYYQEHRERTEIDVIRKQKWQVILGMSWLACHNSEIDWKIGEIKMTRCPEECGKQWRPKQRKPGWQKQKEEEARKEAEERKNNRSKESSRRMRNLGQRKRGSKIRGRGQEAGPEEVSQVDQSLWKE